MLSSADREIRLGIWKIRILHHAASRDVWGVVGRFAKIGIPSPEVMEPFVGRLAGLLTRPAALALAIDMVVAMVSTKLPILIGRRVFGFADPPAGRSGFLAMAHEARTDVSRLLGALCLFVVGAGIWSADARLASRSA